MNLIEKPIRDYSLSSLVVIAIVRTLRSFFPRSADVSGSLLWDDFANRGRDPGDQGKAPST
jgi:hypothetical protein